MDLETGDVAKKNQIFFCRCALDFSTRPHRSNAFVIVEFFETNRSPILVVETTFNDMNGTLVASILSSSFEAYDECD